MAYDKKQMIAGDKIIEYTNDFEDRVEDGFDATKIESGSNSKGSWLKIPDGTLIQWGSIELTYLNSRYLDGIFIFPIPFINSNYVPVVTRTTQVPLLRYYGLVTTCSPANSTQARIRSYREEGDLTDTDTSTAYIITIGKWK